jgi:hypothetical protein
MGNQRTSVDCASRTLITTGVYVVEKEGSGKDNRVCKERVYSKAPTPLQSTLGEVLLGKEGLQKERSNSAEAFSLWAQAMSPTCVGRLRMFF